MSPNAFNSRPPSESSETLPGLIYFLQAASLGVAWTLAKGDKEKYWKLYRFNFSFQFQSLLLVFQGLSMRELKELTAVSDSHLLVGFLLMEFYPWCIQFLTLFLFLQRKGVTCSPGRDKTSWTPNMSMWNYNGHYWGMKNLKNPLKDPVEASCKWSCNLSQFLA